MIRADVLRGRYDFQGWLTNSIGDDGVHGPNGTLCDNPGTPAPRMVPFGIRWNSIINTDFWSMGTGTPGDAFRQGCGSGWRWAVSRSDSREKTESGSDRQEKTRANR